MPWDFKKTHPAPTTAPTTSPNSPPYWLLRQVAHRRLVQSAAEGNFNMLRIWGGAIFEPRAFYDAVRSHPERRLNAPPWFVVVRFWRKFHLGFW